MLNSYAGQLSLLKPISSTIIGKKIVVDVEVINYSNEPWFERDVLNAIKLSYHWLKLSGEPLIWDGLRTSWPTDTVLAPMQSLQTKITVDVPNEIGVYILVLTMVHDGVTWFEEKGFVAATQQIEIKYFDHADTNFLFIGNCQAGVLSHLIEDLTQQITTTSILGTHQLIQQLKSRNVHLLSLIKDSDLIFVHSFVYHQLIESLSPIFPKIKFKIRQFPAISFSAFHPDSCYILDADNKSVQGPMGDYQSAIIYYGWLNRYSKEKILTLFNEAIFKQLGYFDYYQSSVNFLLQEEKLSGLPIEMLLNSWFKKGCWMHTINHPKSFVLIDLAQAILSKENINILPFVDSTDHFINAGIWPVYPEIGLHLGIEGNYQFQSSGRTLSLEEFIDTSYEAYAQANIEERNYSCTVNLASLDDFLKHPVIHSGEPKEIASNAPLISTSNNPYKNLPDYQFWRRAIEKIRLQEVDPIINTRFNLLPTDKIATAGSCFAQHISHTLQTHGFNYYVTEKNISLTKEAAARQNFGVFSARFGNIYTSRQLLQLFDRAYGNFIPIENAWLREDGRFVDPFRPQIEPDGFASIAELEQSRIEHFNAVKQMFENLDVFVFTLGLTEAWKNTNDGAIYPLAPGVVAGQMDPNLHEFLNLSVADIIVDMETFIQKLLKVNSKAKIILTVSPVPLIATYENQHVLVATTYSKSVLRVAAEHIIKQHQICDYFPSYEIITGSYNKGCYFENDLRSIKQDGINHVMQLFLSHYSATNNNQLKEKLLQQNKLLNKIVCDEEALEN